MQIGLTPVTPGAFVYAPVVQLASFRFIAGMVSARGVASQLAFSSAALGPVCM